MHILGQTKKSNAEKIINRMAFAARNAGVPVAIIAMNPDMTFKIGGDPSLVGRVGKMLKDSSDALRAKVETPAKDANDLDKPFKNA